MSRTGGRDQISASYYVQVVSGQARLQGKWERMKRRDQATCEGQRPEGGAQRGDKAATPPTREVRRLRGQGLHDGGELSSCLWKARTRSRTRGCTTRPCVGVESTSEAELSLKSSKRPRHPQVAPVLCTSPWLSLLVHFIVPEHMVSSSPS